MNEPYEFEPKQETTPAYEIPEPVPPKKMRSKRPVSTGVKVTALALCCALLGGIAGLGGAQLLLHTDAAQAESDAATVLVGQRETRPIELQKVDTGKLMTAAEVYASNVNSTVGITTSVTTNFWGYPTTSAASGSGFILTDDGYVLTNYHVIEGSDAITVTLYDGTTYDAALIGYDESLDTAVLKVDAQDLVPVVLGDSDTLNVGDSVIAIGNPLGELTFSLTAGAVSALDREVTMSNGVTMDLIQTDCAINSGNSGGALFNLYGEVIGITNAKYSGSGAGASIDNIGFAIPINDVMAIVTSIIEKGYVSRPYIGVYMNDVSDELQGYGLPQGAAIVQVAENSPAEAAGLQANDIITEVNGEPVSDTDDLRDTVTASQPGDTLTLSVYRQGETVSLTLEVGEQIQSAEEQQTQQATPIYPGFGR